MTGDLVGRKKQQTVNSYVRRNACIVLCHDVVQTINNQSFHQSSAVHFVNTFTLAVSMTLQQEMH